METSFGSERHDFPIFASFSFLSLHDFHRWSTSTISASMLPSLLFLCAGISCEFLGSVGGGRGGISLTQSIRTVPVCWCLSRELVPSREACHEPLTRPPSRISHNPAVSPPITSQSSASRMKPCTFLWDHFSGPSSCRALTCYP